MRAIGLYLLGAATIIGIVMALFITGHLNVFPATSGHQVELVSVFLAAATLVVTAVGVVVALGAVIGYTALKDAINASSERAAQEAADKAMREVMEPFIRRVEANLSELNTVRPEDHTGDIANALSERRP